MARGSGMAGRASTRGAKPSSGDPLLLRRKRAGAILDEAEVAAVSRAALEFLQRNLAGSSSMFSPPRIERIVRYMAVAERFRAARVKAGKSLAEMAKSLRVPQYKLRAIEGSGSTPIDPALFHRYAQTLGLSRRVARWISANRVLARQLGVASAQGARGGLTTA